MVILAFYLLRDYTVTNRYYSAASAVPADGSPAPSSPLSLINVPVGV